MVGYSSKNPNKTKPASCTHTADPSISALQTSIKFSVISRVSLVYPPSPIFVCLPHSHTLRVFLNVLWWSFTGLLGSFPWPPETWPTFWVIELQNMQWKHWYFCMYILTPLYPYTIYFGNVWIWFSFFSPTCPLPLHLIGVDPGVLLPARDVCEQ